MIVTDHDWLDRAIDESKRQTRTEFMKFRRAARKWEPQPPPPRFATGGVTRGPAPFALWLDECVPVPLTTPANLHDPLISDTRLIR